MKIALIPAARNVDSELAFDFGEITPLLLPLRGRPLFCELEEQFKGSGHKCFYLLSSDDVRTTNWLISMGVARSRIIKIFNSESLADTILQGLENVQKYDVEHLIINFADTVVKEASTFENNIYFAVSNQISRWATLSNHGRRIKFQEKMKHGIKKSNVVTGRFEFKSLTDLHNLLWKNVSFYDALEEYHLTHPFCLSETSKWFDFGHIDKYLESKGEYSYNEREFNQIKVDLPRGVISKSSTKKSKLKQEYDWYNGLPSDLKNYAPSVYKYDHQKTVDEIHFEFLPFPPLNDVFLYSNKPFYYWEKFFSSLTDLVHNFWDKKYFTPVDDNDLEEMYSVKTWDRFKYLLSANILTNKELSCLEQQVEKAINIILKESGDGFYPLHGDMCLSNMLFDGRSGQLKVIDPRGAFGRKKHVGDHEYDLAKLSHSFNGNYDFLVNGLFQFNKGNLEVFKSKEQKVITGFFNEWLDQEFPGRERIIRLKEALLFISMIPLHSDRPNSQLAFLANGQEILSEFL